MNELSDREYHDRVMTLVVKLNDSFGEEAVEFSIRINALLTLLALAGAQCTLNKEEFLAATTWQLGEIMSRMTVTETPLQ